VGAIVGFASSITSFLIVAFSGPNNPLTGPNPTWVATDGQGGRPGTQGPGSHHPLKAVS
jgi:hypothetical protein